MVVVLKVRAVVVVVVVVVVITATSQVAMLVVRVMFIVVVAVVVVVMKHLSFNIYRYLYCMTFCATTILLREDALSFMKLINPV
jgi:hypothetical protein